MGVFFSKRKKISRVTDNDKVVLVSFNIGIILRSHLVTRLTFALFASQQLKLQRDNLKKYQVRIEATLENDRNLAKRLLAQGKKE